MGKYDNLKILKKVKARVDHLCISCHQRINAGDFYYAEELKDKFLHSLHKKNFCGDCHKKLNNKKIYGRNIPKFA